MARLRLGCLGDSWVTDREENAEGQWFLVSPLASALRSGLETRGLGVLELISAGFPGCQAENILDVAQYMPIRDLAVVSETGWSIRGDMKRTMADLRLKGGDKEEIDVLVVLLGANDLNHYASGQELFDKLMSLRRLYADRSVDTVLVTVGGAGPGAEGSWPEYDIERLKANARLMQEDAVIDCDALNAKLEVSHWKEGWHLSPEGYALFGDMLAEALLAKASANHLQAFSATRTPVWGKNARGALAWGAPHWAERAALWVSGGQIPRICNVLSGWYGLHGSNGGRPMYRKLGPGGEGVLLYFCDGSRSGVPKWTGWWFGPPDTWDHPGWARHWSGYSQSPPTGGWHVPADGPRDATLRVAYIRG